MIRMTHLNGVVVLLHQGNEKPHRKYEEDVCINSGVAQTIQLQSTSNLLRFESRCNGDRIATRIHKILMFFVQMR